MRFEVSFTDDVAFHLLEDDFFVVTENICVNLESTDTCTICSVYKYVWIHSGAIHLIRKFKFMTETHNVSDS